VVRLFELFEKYADLKVLAYFLSHPRGSFYKKELARALNVSPSTVITAVESFEREGILRKEIKGQGHFYSLDNDNCVVPPLKKAYGLSFVLSARPATAFLSVNPDLISLALYGSYARGDFDEISDIDFLILTHCDKTKLIPALKIIEDRLGKDANISVFRLSDWKAMADSDDAYYKNVVRDHIILHGSDIKWS
jgi:uncharacterized protein